MADDNDTISPIEFMFQGQDQQPQGQKGQQNVHPDTQDWSQKPYTNQGKYNPHLVVLEYHDDGSCHTYDPVLNCRSEEHTAGHHRITAANYRGDFHVGEENSILASHTRPVYGGHSDENYVCHHRVNYGGGLSTTIKGDSATFHGGNHFSVTAGSHGHEVKGNQRNRTYGSYSHTTHDPDGNMTAGTHMTDENTHSVNMDGNHNTTAGMQPRQVSGKGNVVTTAKMNTDQQTGQDWKHTIKGKTQHDTTGGNHTITAKGNKVVLQQPGGMKVPALWPPSIQVG